MLRTLKAAALTEALSLLLLLVNLVTVHVGALASLVGPLHGAAYLTVIATTFLVPDVSRRARWTALVPGVGGMLVLRALPRPGTDPVRPPRQDRRTSQ